MPPEIRLSIVSPVFRAAPLVDDLVMLVANAAALVTQDFEIILVDASEDESWARITAAAERDPRVKGILLSRNFGQHHAITAGLANARGEHVIVMDCDLQDDPRYIPALVAKAEEGFDVVATRRERRQSWIRKLGAALFFHVYNALADNRPADSGVSGYSLITRKVVDSFLRINDAHRQYLMIINWMGFRHAIIPVNRLSRPAGRSSYNLRRLVRLGLAGITSQSNRLLHVAVAIGFIYVAAAAIGIACLVAGYLSHGYLQGWASTIVLLLGSTGLILLGLGILGIYLGNVFDQVRGRPLYLVRDYRNFKQPPL